MALVVGILTYPQGFGRYIAGQVYLQFPLTLSIYYYSIIAQSKIPNNFFKSILYFRSKSLLLPN